eukprot:scaffold54137_cov67-Phaeocystis_antarctica.AAC.3
MATTHGHQAHGRSSTTPNERLPSTARGPNDVPGIRTVPFARNESQLMLIWRYVAPEALTCRVQRVLPPPV